jgi:hypothetical protein
MLLVALVSKSNWRWFNSLGCTEMTIRYKHRNSAPAIGLQFLLIIWCYLETAAPTPSTKLMTDANPSLDPKTTARIHVLQQFGRLSNFDRIHAETFKRHSVDCINDLKMVVFKTCWFSPLRNLFFIAVTANCFSILDKLLIMCAITKYFP